MLETGVFSASKGYNRRKVGEHVNNKRFDKVSTIYETGNLEVYRAYDRVLDQEVACKTIRKNLDDDLLKKEYKLLMELEGSYIVRALTYIEGQSLALVTEYCPGQTLSDWIKSGQLTYDEKLDIAWHMVKGLDQVHKGHVIHKDFNPGNIIWDRDLGILKIIDFNIAQKMKFDHLDFVSTQKMQGTLAFISPEQTGRVNRRLDYRTDFYSLGVSLYYLFTGNLPFKEEDELQLVHRHLAEVPIKPTRLNPGLPDFLSGIIMKLMEKDANNRYQSIEGILYDLDLVKTVEDLKGHILASGDVANQLHLSQSLYGRDKDLSQLLSLFDKACEGSFEYLFVTGPSGIGKTSLIKELYPKITMKSGYFLEGKFDQYKKDMPYSAWIQVLENFIHLIMTESSHKVAKWKTKLEEALGESAGLMKNLVKDLDLIIDLEDQVYARGPELDNQFQQVFMSFMKALSEKDHPVVIFLDDLQWMDTESLNLMKLVFQSGDLDHLYLLGAYRDEEVAASHGLMTSFAEIIQAGSLKLGPLDEESIRAWVDDTFHPLLEGDYLVNNLIKKTHGNAFYIKQVLQAIYDAKCVFYHYQEEVWRIDHKCLDHLSMADNVASFLVDQFKELPGEVVTLLAYGAGLGHSFNLKVMAGVLNRSEEDIVEDLSFLMDQDYLRCIKPGLYAFNHDQIQAAAYSLMTPASRGQVHLEIFNGLLACYQEGMEEDIYQLAYHLNLSSLEQVPHELAYDVFNRAGQLALRNVAYESAYHFYKAGQDFSGTSYARALENLNGLISAAYALGDYENLEVYLSDIKKRATSPYDLTHAYEIELQAHMARSYHQRGLDLILEVLKSFDFDLSLEVKPEDYEAAFVSLNQALDGRPIEGLLDLDFCHDERIVSLMRMITSFLPLIFNAAPQLLVLLVIHMVKLSIRHGNTTYSPYSYAFLGTLMNGVLEDFEASYKYGQVAIDLIDQHQLKTEISKTYMLSAQHIFYLKRHLNVLLDMEEKAYLYGIETGDLTHAGFAAHGYCYNYYLSGRHLGKTYQKFVDYTAAMGKIRQTTQAAFQNMYMATIENLIEESQEPWVLKSQVFDETQDIAAYEQEGNRTAMFVYYFNKMQLAYYFKAYDQARVFCEALGQYLDGGLGLMHVGIFHQFRALILLSLYPNQDVSLEEVDQDLAYLSRLKEEINFGHRYQIVLAEKYRVLGDHDQARRAYEEAIRLSQDHRYIQDEALYRERASDFYQGIGSQELASYYLTTSHACYKSWGALNKANRLLEAEDLLQGDHHTRSLHSRTSYSDNLDIRSVLTLSQTIANEVKYEDLVKKMMTIIMENSGGDRAVLIICKETSVQVTEAGLETIGLPMAYDNLSQIPGLAQKVVNYVYHSKRTVTIDISHPGHHFRDDPYIVDGQVKSILCIPLLLQGRITGMIYLENRVSSGVFSQDRLEYISLLSSQIAISLKNATIYEDLEDLVEARTQDLEKKNQQLHKLNEKLETLSVTDGLTGLYNRRKLDQTIDYELARLGRYGGEFSLILLDIDHFKGVNDTYGHDVGDRVLIRFASLISSNIRQTDLVGRWGGEEFLILCPNLSLEAGVQLADKLRRLIEDHDFSPVASITSSFGVVAYQPSETANHLVKRVDDCLYKAKEKGRNRVEYL